MRTRKNKIGGNIIQTALKDFKEDGTPIISILRNLRVKEHINNITTCNKKGRSPESLSYLINRDISQSACIKLGVHLEEIFNIYLEYLMSERYTRENKNRSEKGVRQKDILFKDKNSNSYIYAEIKANINLDTQKLPATIKSIKDLEKEYKDISFQAYIISLRYLSTKDIPENLKKKYNSVNLIGIHDFLQNVLSIDFPIEELKNYENYSNFLEILINKIEC
jgi:hypothetical protein